MTEKEKTTEKRTRRPSAGKTSDAKTTREQLSRDEVRKQQSELRKKRYRRKKIIGYCVAVAAVVAVGIVLSLTVFFKIETVAVTGDEIYNSETIIDASQIKTGDNMFLFDKDDAAKNIESTLPYIEKAEIKRGITGVITINITAAKATLAIDMGDSYTLLSSSCKVLEDGVMVINDDITVISASTVLSAAPGQFVSFENEADIDCIVSVQKIIEKYELKDINAINASDSSNVKLTYARRIELKIGAASEFESKIDFIKATLAKHDTDEPSFYGSIDFGIENKAYIKPADESTTAAAVA